jgi:hypothetical protein
MSPVIHDGWGERCAMKRWMALDIGEKRIGVAVSDPSGTIGHY